MAVPKRRHTRSRSGKRRGGKVKVLPALVVCRNCKNKKFRHRACPHCGELRS